MEIIKSSMDSNYTPAPILQNDLIAIFMCSKCKKPAEQLFRFDKKKINLKTILCDDCSSVVVDKFIR